MKNAVRYNEFINNIIAMHVCLYVRMFVHHYFIIDVGVCMLVGVRTYVCSIWEVPLYRHSCLLVQPFLLDKSDNNNNNRYFKSTVCVCLCACPLPRLLKLFM